MLRMTDQIGPMEIGTAAAPQETPLLKKTFVPIPTKSGNVRVRDFQEVK